jgi:hypothetical protein
MNTDSSLLPFGKHKGKTFEEIRRSDISYCNWVLQQDKTRGDMKIFQDWLKTVSKKITCQHCNGSGLGHMM